MPMQPTRQNYHVDVPLTDLSVAWMQEQKYFIHNKVFPQVQVAKQSARYFVYAKGDFFRTQAAKRSPNSESAGTNYRIDSTPTYFADVWAVHHDIGWQEYANYNDPLQPEEEATEIVSRNLMLRREKIFLAQYMQPSIWQGFQVSGSPADFSPNTSPGGNGYWDSATGNPIKDVDYLKGRMLGTSGFVPNKITMSYNVFQACRNNPQVIDRIKYTQRGVVTAELLAGLFDVDEVLVAGAVYNNAQEGQTDSLGVMTNNSFLLSYSPASAGLRVPSAGYIFTWTGYLGAGAFGNTMSKFEVPLHKADRYEGEMAFAMNRVCPDLGIFGVNVLGNP